MQDGSRRETRPRAAEKHEGAYRGLHDVDNVGNEGQRVVLRLRVASTPRQIEPEVNGSTMEPPTWTALLDGNSQRPLQGSKHAYKRSMDGFPAMLHAACEQHWTVNATAMIQYFNHRCWNGRYSSQVSYHCAKSSFFPRCGCASMRS